MGEIGLGRFVRQVVIAAVIAGLVAAYPLYVYGSPRLVWSVVAGCGVCILNVLAGCWAIAWAVRKPRKVFFPAVFGSMGIRTAVIGVVVLALVKATDVHVAGFIGSLFGFFFLFQTMEVLFLTRRLPRLNGVKQEG